MKCRACWTDKAYVREVRGWGGTVYSWLGMVPLKCHHCYHRFTVPWFLTIGKRLTPPVLKTRLAPATASGQHSLSGHPAESDSDSRGPLHRAA